MPNWCSNRLEVYGPAEELQRFRTEATGVTRGELNSPLVFSSLVPIPEGLDDSEQYNYRKKHWGTQGDAVVIDVFACPDQVVYTFDTAWNPPLNWVETVAAMYPTLNFDLYFYELGVFCAGGIECRRGSVYKIEEYTEEGDVSEFILEAFDFDISELLEENDG